VTIDKSEWFKEHLTYEWQMLRYAYGRLSAVTPPSPDWSCFFECFALHARNLYEFLTSERDNRNFKASDFIEHYAADKNDLTKGVFQKIDAQMMHMSKARPSEASGKFNKRDAAKLMNWFNLEMGAFMEQMPDEIRSNWRGLPSQIGVVAGAVAITNDRDEVTHINTPSPIESELK